MKVIHVARKPLAGTVASTALKYGTGGLNIDRSRIGTQDDLNGGAYSKDGSDRPDYEDWRFKRGDKGNAGEYQQPAGRWPANLILEHKPGCKKLGTRKVEGHVIRHYEGDKANRAYGFYIVDEENRGQDQKVTTVLQQPDIIEDVYECVPDCPCVMLDEQSGERRSAGHYPSESRGTGEGLFGKLPQGQLYDDEGGAARFFKQVGGRPIDPPK